MRLSWFGEFFGAIPDALGALYRFGDPNGLGEGWWGILIAIIWGVGLTATPLYFARRWHGTREWASATMGVIAATSIFWWIFGVIPSAWIYFVDSEKEIIEHAIIPSSMRWTIFGKTWNVATDLYLIIRDTVVVVQQGAAVTLTIWAALRIQKEFPKTLAEGEIKPAAGGYH